jgi:hypothetical protein
MAKTPGAFMSSQEDIELHLVAKAEQLELLLQIGPQAGNNYAVVACSLPFRHRNH